MTLHLLPLRRMTMNTHFGPIIAPMNGMLMRMMTATLSLFIGGAATAVDQVSIVATTPVCIEDDAANPSVFTISRTSGSGNLPVTIDVFGSATLGLDYSLPSGFTYGSRAVRILRGGNYSGPPSVSFSAAPGGGTRTVGNGVIGIGSAPVLAPGEYAAAPSVTIVSPTGQSASLIPILAYKTIYAPQLDPIPVVRSPLTSSPPRLAGGIAATGSINDQGRLVISSPGFGYEIGEAVTFTAPNVGVVATGKAVYQIVGVTIASSGAGYGGSESVVITPDSLRDARGPGGILNPSGAQMTDASITKTFTVVAVDITTPGAGYLNAPPTVTFTTPSIGSDDAVAEVSTVRTSILIPDGQASTTLNAIPIADKKIELGEEIQVSLIPVDPAIYGVGAPSSATAVISDDDMIVGWNTVDASAEEDLLGATPDESIYSYVISRATGVPNTENPLTIDRTLKMQLTGTSAATLNTDFKLTYMYRHLNQPLGKTMLELRTTDSDLLNGWQVPTGFNLKKGGAVINYVRGPGELSVGDVIQFGVDKDNTYIVTSLNASFFTISPGLVADVGENTLIRNNLDILFSANGGIQGNVLPGVLGFDTYSTIDFTITPVYDGTPEGSESLGLKLLSSNDYLLADPQTQIAVIGDDDVLPSISLSSNAARPTVLNGTVTIGAATIVLNAPITKDIVFPYSISGNAIAGVDYQALSGTVTVPAGSTSATIQIVPLFTATTGAKTVVITLIDTQDYLLSGSDSGIRNSSTTVNILDQAGTVSVTAFDPTATESEISNADPGVFRVSIVRVGSTSPAVSVNYSITGSANPGSDYVVLSGSTTIPAGQNSVDIPVVVVDDVIFEPTEDVTLTLTSAAGYNVASLNASASVQILDNEPVVQISSNGNLAEPSTKEQITVFYPSSSLNRSISIPYVITGSATPSVDFSGLPSTFTIPAGSNSATFTISVIDDAIAEGPESVTLTLQSGTTYSINAVSSFVTVQIADDEPFVALVRKKDGREPALSADAEVFLVNASGVRLENRDGPAISVSYQLSPSVTLPATAGLDYTAPSGTGLGSVTIAQNQVSALITVPVLDDSLAEGDEGIVVTLKPSTNYTLTGNAALNTASLLIEDNESTLTVIKDKDAFEGRANGVVRISNRGGPVSAAVTVRYGITGSARAGLDYEPLSGVVTIPAGTEQIDIPVDSIDNSLLDPARTVIITLKTSTFYVIGGTGSATINIIDDDINGGSTGNGTADIGSGGGSCGLGGGVAVITGVMVFLGTRLRRERRA